VFTGIVEGIGEIKGMERRGDVLSMRISLPPALTGVEVGDSISVDGVCLTIVSKKGQEVVVEVSEETSKRTVIGQYGIGRKVNLERALEAGGRMGGHFVTGHVDGVGEVLQVERGDRTFRLRVKAPREVSRYLVEKGSVALNGVSLTVNKVEGDEFETMIIPFTALKTTLSELKVGDRVNLEADILAKYVERLLPSGSRGGIDEEFLAEHGFLR